MAMQKHTKLSKELELIRGYERVVMPKVSEELMSSIKNEYEHWFKYDSINNNVLVMRLLGEAFNALESYEVQVNELQAEVQRLSQIAKY
jgi:hypothetical protein